MKTSSRFWAATSLICVGCFTDVGVGTRDEAASGGEGDGAETGGTGQGATDNASGAHGGTTGEPTGAGGSRTTAGTGGSGTTGGSRATGGRSGALGSGGSSTSTAGTPGSGGATASTGGKSDAGGAGGAGASGGTGNTGGTSVTLPACGTSLEATEASNYSVSSTITLDVAAVRPTADITVDWSALTRDLRGRPIEGIDMLELALWPLDIATLERQLIEDTLNNPIIIAYLDPGVDATSANLLDLRVPDGPIGAETLSEFFSVENYPPANNVYTVMLANGFDLGRGTRMIKAFRLDPGSDNTDVVIDSTSTQIAMAADLHTLAPLQVPAATSNLLIDWRNLRVTGAGGEFIPSSITRVDIAKFSESVSELEESFRDLDELADERYSADVIVGTSFDLAKTRDAKGFFPGIDASGTWLLALSCGACQNPAPWYVTVLEPCAP